jgi:hypothetical protein
MRYTEEVRFRENAAVGRSLGGRPATRKRLHRLKVVDVGKENWLQSSAAQGKVVALDPFPYRIAARIKALAGNLFVPMFDQMPNALLCAFPILDQHGIRLQSSNRPVESDNRNAALLNHSQSPAVTA